VTLAFATVAVASSALIGNRILALLVGFWLKVPSLWLLAVLLTIDAVQIPFYYWLYSQGAKGLQRLPAALRRLFSRAASTPIGAWILAGGRWGVFAVAALPAFGGGIWTATLMAYNLGIPRRYGALWMIAASALSYLTLWSLGEGVLKMMHGWTL